MSLQVLTPQVEWGWEVVAYLFLAGLGAGAYMAAVVARRMNKEKYAAFSATGIHLSWIVTVVGIGALFLHLGRPERFMNAFANPGSWMTLGASIVTLFVVFGILSSLFLTKINVSDGINLAVQIVGVLLAFGTAIYTGILIAVLNAKPFWYSPLIPWLFVASALSTGIVATALGLLSRTEQREVVSRVDRIDAPLIVVELVIIAAFLTTVGARDAVAIVISGPLAPLFIIGVVLVGLLLPLGLSIYAGYSEKSKPVAPSLFTLNFACVLLGGLLLRYVILIAGQI